MDEDEKACPFCAETIRSAAIKCKHCGEMLAELDTPMATTQPKITDESRNDVLYAKHGLEITPRVIKAPNMSFQMANLNSVRKIKTPDNGAHAVNQGCGVVAAALGLFVLVIGAASSSGGGGGTGSFFFIGIAGMAVGAYLMTASKPAPESWMVQIMVDDKWVNLCVQMDEVDAAQLEASVNEGFSRLRTSR